MLGGVRLGRGNGGLGRGVFGLVREDEGLMREKWGARCEQMGLVVGETKERREKMEEMTFGKCLIGVDYDVESRRFGLVMY